MSIVRVFYVPQAFAHTVLVRVSEEMIASTKQSGNVCALYDRQMHLIGYNITMDLQSEHNGYQPMDEALLKRINEELQENGFPLLVHDFTPRIVVGYIRNCTPHPDSDHLHVCEVDVGSDVVQIVCGSINVKADCYVVAALDQAVMPDGKWIRSGAVRGVASAGMLCSRYELGFDKEKGKGLLILDDAATIGSPFLMTKEQSV